MDERAMMNPLDLPLIPLLPACFVAGLILGYAYFAALRHTAGLIVKGGQPLLGLALTFGRLALLGGGFWLAVQAGALALLTALAGVLGAKAVILRRARQGESA
ncbi:ATP synthase subunit I [Pseudooceanicola sp.]|uniref:N-ATPase subunit AtpR n=1 Tax=Pseudooceanicola sp. TaxID=1914328 RepID=UPI002618E668|nr:ATP synthase subunit I [Pseudooceanicola sp.]MDF1856560.1 ATP synthase subunit I [Pseudooceanicola sp.]